MAFANYRSLYLFPVSVQNNVWQIPIPLSVPVVTFTLFFDSSPLPWWPIFPYAGSSSGIMT